MKRKWTIIIIVVLIACSVGFLLYPTISTSINNYYARGTVVQYNQQVDSLSDTQKNEYLEAAKKYNLSLSENVSDSFSPDAFNVSEEYDSILNVTEDGQLASISIPKTECNLPIYHGSSKDNLTKGAIHMASTSFPIGGENTHSVVSAHTAYPGKEFFNRLTELEIGDEFNITILGDTLWYRVCDINIVLPSDSSKLRIQRGRDLVTLVTCTPYSVNTHRLLVTGERFTPVTTKATSDETVETAQYEPVPIHRYIIAVLAAIIVFAILTAFIIKRRRKRNENKEE